MIGWKKKKKDNLFILHLILLVCYVLYILTLQLPDQRIFIAALSFLSSNGQQ